MNRMQKPALAVVFCVCLGMPLSAVPQGAQPACPDGLVCVSKADAAAIVRNFNAMAAELDQAAAIIEKQERAIADLKAKKACM